MSDAPEAVQSEVISTSRLKTILFALGSLGFVAAGVTMINHGASDDHVAGWLVMAFFGLATIVFGWLIIRPQVLTLDGEGFTLAGGLMRKSRTELWRNIDRFVLFRAGRSHMIGYNYAPGGGKQNTLIKLNRSLGAEAGIPGSWPQSNSKMVDLLNDRLRQSRGLTTAP